MTITRVRAGEEWSRAAWRRHLPGVDDPGSFVDRLGDATLPQLAQDSAKAVPDRMAVRIDGDGSTHGELDADAARVAGWLAERIRPGDRVLLAGPSSLDFLRSYLGALRAGAVVVLANPTYTVPELGHLIEDSGAVFAFAGKESAARVAELPAPPSIVHLDPAGSGTTLREVLSHAPDAGVHRAGPDDIALLAYTSGTTGRPKGVPLTHRHLLTSIRSAMAAWRWTADDVLVHALPLYHQHGLGGVHATLIAGSSARLLSRFSAEALVEAVREAGASVLFAVPTMYERLVDAADLPDAEQTLRRLRLCVCGSAPLSEELAQRAARLLGRLPLVRYGTTETGLDVSNPYDPAGAGAHANTVGLPLPGVLTRIATDTDREAGHGVDGEIQLRGPQVFTGYWRNPEATAEAFTSDGWFRTGDIGMVDPESRHLVIRGRTKELIITGGLNVYPREVEVALETHPAVAEAAVAGLPHESWGEQVTAWVVTRPGPELDAATFGDELIRYARSRLAPYKCPKQVFVVDALPRNHMGKIVRSQLVAPTADAPDVPPLARRAVRTLRAASLIGHPDVRSDVPAAPLLPEGQDAATAVRAALGRAAETAGLGAFVRTFPEAVDAAEALDAERAAGSSRGPLHGVPVALKDMIDVAEVPVRNGTPGLGHRVPAVDSEAWRRLRDAGCVLIGLTTLHELAWGVVTPGCVNPRSTDRMAGGSSGGSAAAVAAGVVPVALGTDTGGSVRIPAALCGVAGLRPTAGSISVRGVTPLAPSMDTVGPIARTAWECLAVHGALGGAVGPVPESPVGMRIGWPAGLWSGRVQPAVADAIEAAARTLGAAGAEIVEVDLPLAARYARAASYIVMLAESAALWHPALLAQPAGVSQPTAELLRAGADLPASDYRLAQRISTAIRVELDGVLSGHRLAALLLPTVPVTAAHIGTDTVTVGGRSEPISVAYSRLTALASVTGHPALTVPAGLDERGLPVGAQLIGARHGESTLCLLGSAIEAGLTVSDSHQRDQERNVYEQYHPA